MALTEPQERFLARHRENPARKYNGRALAMVKRPAAAAGYLTYDLDLIPHVIGKWTFEITVTLTEKMP